ncbi:lytic murein transglycosylase [Firmicutes bacterium CAG:238]|nr:lytic murein transglycosylase [Firmicutes bacterium CAG:238]
MFKKLIAVLMALAVAACSAVPVYADLDQVTTGVQTEQQTAEPAGTGEIGSTGEQEQAPNTNDSESGQNSGNDQTGENVEPADTKDQDKDKDKVKKPTKKKISKYQKGLAGYIRSKNRKLSKQWSITLAGYFIKSGKKHDIDPKVLMGLALRESNFRAKAKSRYGYKGMMQCGDSFAKRYGYKPSDLYKADVSIEIAAKYLKAMKKRHKTYSKAICCYVCGSGAVARGVHSREPGRSVMKVRSNIKTFLKNNGYV